MKSIDGEGNRLVIKSWCDDMEKQALTQAINLSNHPCTFRHVALMPDCHVGYGMPIGGVVALKDAVIPNAVGVDIGCGVRAVKTDRPVEEIEERQIARVFHLLKSAIPVGFKHHKSPQEWEGFDQAPVSIPVIEREMESARKQLGTLGGGNHFIEIQNGDDGLVWLMIHSGSRNFGYKIAKEYNRKAQELCTRLHAPIPPFKGEDGLAFLPIGEKVTDDYIRAMSFALEFARANRAAMMKVFEEIAAGVLGASALERIDIHHNYAQLEHHFGEDVWIHRKGATPAFKDKLGVIPGSMGTASYIVRGLGNPESFESCSHGAGRKMGRGEFSRTHTVEECNREMEGIVFGGWNKGRKGQPDLSEAPSAYKDIDEVMAAQADLVEPVVALRPLGVMKG